jgi:hypothetical protein
MNTLPITKSSALMWTSNGLMKSRNFSTRTDESFFSSPQMFSIVPPSNSKNNFFLKRFESGFTNYEKPFINFQ